MDGGTHVHFGYQHGIKADANLCPCGIVHHARLDDGAVRAVEEGEHGACEAEGFFVGG